MLVHEERSLKNGKKAHFSKGATSRRAHQGHLELALVSEQEVDFQRQRRPQSEPKKVAPRSLPWRSLPARPKLALLSGGTSAQEATSGRSHQGHPKVAILSVLASSFLPKRPQGDLTKVTLRSPLAQIAVFLMRFSAFALDLFCSLYIPNHFSLHFLPSLSPKLDPNTFLHPWQATKTPSPPNPNTHHSLPPFPYHFIFLG